MISDKDIAQALKQSKQKPSTEWQNATLKRLREVSSENHVTESVEVRNSLRDASTFAKATADRVASLASYFFPTSTMKPVFLKTIGSLAAVCVITAGTHAVANGSTPESSFLYTIDRGFERAELAFASIGGKASVAHKHLMHAEERSTEIDVLLRGEASASVSFKEILVPTAFAQSGVEANAHLSAHVKLLVDDCRASLNRAVEILEEIADSASAKTRAELAVAVEMTSKNIWQRLEASAKATTKADVRPVVAKAVDTANKTERKARSIKAQIDVGAKAEAEASEDQPKKEGSTIKSGTRIKSDTEVDTRSGIEVDTDTSVDTGTDIDLPEVEVESDGNMQLNLGTNSKRRSGGDSAATKMEAEGNTETSTTTENDTSSKGANTSSGESEQKTSGSSEVEVDAEVNVEAEGSTDTDILDTKVEQEAEMGVDATLNGGLR